MRTYRSVVSLKRGAQSHTETRTLGRAWLGKLKFPTSGANSPDPAQDSQALDLKRPPYLPGRPFRFEGYRTGQARPEILSYRLDFAASQQDTFRVRASVGLPVRPYLYRQCALTCVRFASEASDTHTKLELLDMAQAWTKLADQAEKNSHLVNTMLVQHPQQAPQRAQLAE